MSAAREHLADPYEASPTERRESIAAGLSRAIDLSRQLRDRTDCEALICQLTGCIRGVQQLAALLGREAEPNG